VTDDHRELRWAFDQFLAARRALHRAYQESRGSPGPSKSIPTLEWRAAGRASDDSTVDEELLELKDENKELRKSLALLHAYSLRVQEQRDMLAGQRDRLLDACRAIASWMQDNEPAWEAPTDLWEQLNDAIDELPIHTYIDFY
jgi:hypothetical protein